MRAHSVFAVALCLAGTVLAGAAGAQPILLAGTIGKAPVLLELDGNGDTLSGWYTYLKVGKQIRLEGKVDHNGFFAMDEHAADTNSRTGALAGRAKDGHWTGTWKNAAGQKKLPVAFDVVKGRLKGVSGRFKCTTKRNDPQFGSRYTHSIELTLNNGQVKALAMKRAERSSGGEKQSCAIGSGQLRQVPARVGILLRAKADRTEAGPHCTIRIYGAGDYLVIKTGNPSQSGDECRAAGNEMFCSPRSFWADMIVNRKTQGCKSVE